MAYYYLISSLPMLKENSGMPISYSEFLGMCKQNLSTDKYEILEKLTLSSKNGPVVSKWAEFYSVFQDELNYQRNLKAGKKARLPYNRDEAVSKLISDAINNKNPLEAEVSFLELQFKKIDELIGTHYFDDYALIGYALKLKLLERREIFDKENGKKEFDKIVNKLEEQIMQMEKE